MYQGVFRSNYFRVKNEKAFRSFIDSCYAGYGKLELFEKVENDGNKTKLFAFAGDTDICSTESNGEYQEDGSGIFLNTLMEYVADGDAAIVTFAGHDKFCYVSAYAVIVTSSTIECMDLAIESANKAAELLGNPDWQTTMDY